MSAMNDAHAPQAAPTGGRAGREPAGPAVAALGAARVGRHAAGVP